MPVILVCVIDEKRNQHNAGHTQGPPDQVDEGLSPVSARIPPSGFEVVRHHFLSLLRTTYSSLFLASFQFPQRPPRSRSQVHYLTHSSLKLSTGFATAAL